MGIALCGLGSMPGEFLFVFHSLHSFTQSLISNLVCAAKAHHGQTQNQELTALLMQCERLATNGEWFALKIFILDFNYHFHKSTVMFLPKSQIIQGGIMIYCLH